MGGHEGVMVRVPVERVVPGWADVAGTPPSLLTRHFVGALHQHMQGFMPGVWCMCCGGVGSWCVCGWRRRSGGGGVAVLVPEPAG